MTLRARPDGDFDATLTGPEAELLQELTGRDATWVCGEGEDMVFTALLTPAEAELLAAEVETD